ncbi:hypothetical protein [Dokdonella sp.]|uniref:hypothetical protein n=1 Tax=Dokdonella sp. TaxID=2291710 RepID=UPI001B18B6C8|nr:hypothetical protein [Dokdonella sp.]MBO9663843.1 hypothetical protein [Dokdonella sp.]
MLRWIALLSLPLACAALAQSSFSVDPFAGRWTGDAAPAAVDGAGAPGAPAAPDGGSGSHRHGAGMGGGKGHAGGTRGGAHRPETGASRGAAADPERSERGLARLFAEHVTITPLSTRVRFDDGEHAVELDRDGMNVSGPGVGGTVALSQTSPDLVVETLTDSGYSLRERYHLGENGELELHATLKRPFADEPREFVRVFRRAAAPAPAAAALKP